MLHNFGQVIGGLILDSYDRKIIDYALSGSSDSELTKRALNSEFEFRVCPEGVMFTWIIAIIIRVWLSGDWFGNIKLNKV